MVEILIQNGKNIYIPSVLEGIQLDLERKNVPGKLTFSVVKRKIGFTEGNPVSLRVNGKGVFYGFIFSMQRDKSDIIQVTAYDQMRYLKNKDTYVYSNMTVTEVIRMIAADFRLQTGSLDNTSYKIASRVEDNKTLFDIIQNAMDLTLMNTGKIYVLYDKFGKLTLKNIENMKLELLFDIDTGQNIDFTTSIDGQTYNKIKLSYSNQTKGGRDIYIAQDSANMNRWGVLQYYETIDENTVGQDKANALLSLYNKKTRNLTIKDAFGDIRVRGGSSVVVNMKIGDVSLKNYLMVEKVKHIFEDNSHTMTMTLRGGDINV